MQWTTILNQTTMFTLQEIVKPNSCPSTETFLISRYKVTIRIPDAWIPEKYDNQALSVSGFQTFSVRTLSVLFFRNFVFGFWMSFESRTIQLQKYFYHLNTRWLLSVFLFFLLLFFLIVCLSIFPLSMFNCFSIIFSLISHSFLPLPSFLCQLSKYNK